MKFANTALKSWRSSNGNQKLVKRKRRKQKRRRPSRLTKAEPAVTEGWKWHRCSPRGFCRSSMLIQKKYRMSAHCCSEEFYTHHKPIK